MLRLGGRRASRSQGDNVIFSEPPTGAATPLLGAAALVGGALPGGSICGLGARAGGGRGRRASRSQGDNVIFSEPPTGAATPLLGAAALVGGALPGGSICGLAAGARAGARGIMSFLASPQLARRPRCSGPPRSSAARSLAARSAAWGPARGEGAAGARAGARGIMSFLASPQLARRPRCSGPPRSSAARSLAARSAAWRPAREQEPGAGGHRVVLFWQTSDAPTVG